MAGLSTAKNKPSVPKEKFWAAGLSETNYIFWRLLYL